MCLYCRVLLFVLLSYILIYVHKFVCCVHLVIFYHHPSHEYQFMTFMMISDGMAGLASLEVMPQDLIGSDGIAVWLWGLLWPIWSTASIVGKLLSYKHGRSVLFVCRSVSYVLQI